MQPETSFLEEKERYLNLIRLPRAFLILRDRHFIALVQPADEIAIPASA
jgi:hypothetical protein